MWIEDNKCVCVCRLISFYLRVFLYCRQWYSSTVRRTHYCVFVAAMVTRTLVINTLPTLFSFSLCTSSVSHIFISHDNFRPACRYLLQLFVVRVWLTVIGVWPILVKLAKIKFYEKPFRYFVRTLHTQRRGEGNGRICDVFRCERALERTMKAQKGSSCIALFFL